LHAVAVVKSGVFGVIRVVGFVFGPRFMAEFGLNNILMVFAGATIILASLLALKQDNLKRRLAYSTVGHLSYIVLGAALLISFRLYRRYIPYCYSCYHENYTLLLCGSYLCKSS
jgi:formate hydrogenlyase subunit 3/multisubunit Na+/H+ antiporter MnhD subunit